MPFVNMPKIIAQEVNMPVLVASHAGVPEYEDRDVGYNMCPLPKTWYEEEFDNPEPRWENDTYIPATRTIRFAKRSDHTGILIQINKAEFLKLRGTPS